ncbi:RHS repeat-associated core domain-containing protein [bacterium]|nr:RHS repeat-associated core domain-containing protein [bacterium]
MSPSTVGDARGNTAWEYEYDNQGRVVEAEDALGKTWSYAYDAAWNLSSKTDAKNVTTNFIRDSFNRVTKIDTPGTTQDVTIAYDPTGHITSMTNSTIAFTFDYDAKYRLKEKKDTTHNLAITYEYSCCQKVTKMADPSSGETTYSYDELNRVTAINDAQGDDYEFEYDKDGRRKKLTYGNGSYTNYYYDDAGRIVGTIDNLRSDGSTVSSIEYTLDACGQVTAKVEYGIGETEFDYDAEGQLTSVDYASGASHTFTYDDNGNRLTWTRTNRPTTTYAYNAADQLTQSTEGTIGTTYTHDDNGNLTSETTGGITRSFNYDALDRLTSVTEGMDSIQTMTYGPDSKRLSLTDASGTRKFYYDGNDVIQEYNSDWSSVRMEYTHGPWIDEPLSMTDHTATEANNTHYLMKDRLGSIINILDNNENVVTTYNYDAFGAPTATYHSGQIDCMYRFTGRVFDGAMGKYFYRARYYNQSLGRFFSRDPIMSLGSLYSYCSNSPENFTDPTGMLTTQQSSLSVSTPFGMYHPGYCGPMLPCAGFWRNLWNKVCGRGADSSKDYSSGSYDYKHTSTDSDGKEHYDMYYKGTNTKVGECSGHNYWDADGQRIHEFHLYYLHLGGLSNADVDGVDDFMQGGMSEKQYWGVRGDYYANSSIAFAWGAIPLSFVHPYVGTRCGFLSLGMTYLSKYTRMYPDPWFY